MRNGTKHREFTRVSTEIEAEVTATVSGHTRDVSVKGIYLFCRQPLPVGTPCRVALVVGGRQSPLRIEVTGRVVRVDDAGMAVEFSEMGVDSFDHLRRLVLYNSTDTDQVEQELKSHLGLKRRK
jgi:hypothetical protein